VTVRIPLRLAVLTIAVIFGLSVLPPAVASSASVALPATGQPLTPASFPITHYVIIMLENHAYDTLFGTYCETYGGYCDNTGQGLNLSYCMPLFPAAPAKGCHKEYSIPPTTQLTDIPHGYQSTPLAWNDGAMNNFYRAEWGYPYNYTAANETFSYYNTTGDSLFSDIAEEYGLSDNFYSSNMSYSLPNHWFAQAGAAPAAAIHLQIGYGSNAALQGNDTCNSLCYEAEADYEDGQYTPKVDEAAAQTVDEAYLDEANTTATFQDLFNGTSVSWKYYDDPLPKNYSDAIQSGSTFGYWNPNVARAETYQTQFDSHYVARNQFFTDAAAGALPNVSWVIAPPVQSCHPPWTVGDCESFVAQYVNAVESSPDWDSTAVFVTMDEYGGFYDSVAPPTVPALNGSGLGFRVPLLVVSPYTPEGYISNHLGYFESFLRTIEWKFGLPSLTERDATAPLLTEFFDLNATPRPPMQFAGNYTQATYPAPFQSLPVPNSPVMVHATTISSTEAQLTWSEGSGGGPVNGWKVMVGPTVYHLDRLLREFNVTGLPAGQDVPIYLESTDGPLTSAAVEVTPGLSVTFVEVGLPSGTSWSVTLNGVLQTSSSSEIAFTQPNGTQYSYTLGSVPGYLPTPSLGEVTLNGSGREIQVTFSQEFPVAFTESGLPNGTAWNVTIGSALTSATSATIRLFEPNGTYRYLVATANREYAALGGTFSTLGAAVSLSVNFSLVRYAVTFVESNLPAGSTWYLNVTGVQSLNSTGSTIAFTQPNGTYTYTVATGDSAFAPSTGSFSVNGSATNESITFGQASYSVTFSETDLPSGTTWYVNVTNWGSLSATVAGLAGTEVSANFTTGTYDFTVASANKIYSPGPEPPLVVNDAPGSLDLAFSEVTYSVTFAESGLPSGTPWNVTIGDVTLNSSAPIAFAEPNGTYPFTVEAADGFVVITPVAPLAVNGSARDVLINLGPRYSITFTEIGLPSSTPWNVTIGSIELSSTTSTLVFPLSNGSYTFRIGNVPGWTTRYTGSVVVSGSKSAVSRTFTEVQYVVTFTESGLSTGTNWSVTVGTTTLHSTTTFLNFHLTNGTYNYFVANIANHSRTPTGSFVLAGAGVTIRETFPLVTYVAVFKESGLPSTTNWSVTVGSMTHSSTLSYISFDLPNGSYADHVANISGYSHSPGGNFSVVGSRLAISVEFSSVDYAVTFAETGLKTRTNWSVTVGSTQMWSTHNYSIFHLANGSYDFIVANVANYTGTPTTGTFAVAGRSLTVMVQFSLVKYRVTLTESGLPSHTLWQVSVAGIPHSATGPSVSYTLANGSYTYNATAAGSGFSTSNRSFIVNGGATGLTIPFSRLSVPVARGWGELPVSEARSLATRDSARYAIAPLREPWPARGREPGARLLS
jgi:phospholipase C